MGLKKITWDDFDGKTFQEFCNALLLLTVSKRAKVYSKPGGDKGNDQLYNGPYLGNSGKWRFQDKFHLGKESAASYLKKAITKDIKDNFGQEDNLVFITNCNLLPQEEELLLKIAHDEIANRSDRKIIFDIWHHGKLDAMIKEAPLLYYWYWQPDHIALKEYKDAFSNQLDKTNLNLPYQFHSVFVGRGRDIESLNAFLGDPNATTLPILGEGGTGKTRLCVEFFKKHIEASPEYIGLVVTDNFIEHTNLNQLLSSHLKYMILVDDAHSKPQVLNWINHFAQVNKGRVKVVFTTRSSLYNEAISTISTHERLFSKDNAISLTPLDRLETYNIVKTILPNIFYDDYITKLTMISQGNPGLILALCQQVLQGKSFHQVIKDGNFNERIAQIIDEMANEISRITGIVRERVIKTIHLLAVIGPVGDVEENRGAIATLVDISLTDLEILFEAFRIRHLMPKYELAIKPDPYSDSIFISVATSIAQIKGWYSKQLTGKMRANFLQNLIVADSILENKTNQADILLYQFIGQLKNYDIGYLTLIDVIQSVNQISFLKPDIATYCCKIFTEICQDPDHPIHKNGRGSWRKSEIELVSEETDKLLQNAFVNTNRDGKNEERLAVLIDYARICNRPAIISTCFRLSKYDLEYYRYTFPAGFVRQEFIAPRLADWLLGDDKLLSEEAFKIIQHFLELDHHDEGLYNPITSAISLINWKIDDRPVFHELRKHSLEALISYVKQTNANSDLRKRAVDSILHVLFFIVKDNRKQHYNGADEVTQVAGFIEKNINKGAKVKLPLFHFLQIFKKREIKKEYKKLYDRLFSKAKSAKSDKEKLFLLVNDRQKFAEGNEFEKEKQELLACYRNSDDMFSDLLAIRPDVEDGWLMNFNAFVTAIAEKYPIESRKSFEKIIEFYPDYINDFISILRINFRDENYFYGQIEKIWSINNGKYRSLAIWALTSGRKEDRGNYRERDFKYFEQIVDDKNRPAVSILNYELPQYAVINKEKTFFLLKRIMDEFSDLKHSEVLDWLFYSHKDIVTKFKSEVKELILYHTFNESLSSHNLSKALPFLENEFGFETLFDYVKERLKHYKSYTGIYFSLIELDHQYFNPEVGISKSIDNYFIVLKWFIDLRTDEYHMPESLLKLFLPRDGFTNELCERFKSFSHNYAKSKEALAMVSKAFNRVHNISEEFIDLVLDQANKYLQFDKTATDKVFNNLFFNHIIHGDGSKHGRAGEPFPVDVAKKKTLESYLSKHSDNLNPRLRGLLTYCLEQVNDTIRIDTENGKGFSY